MTGPTGVSFTFSINNSNYCSFMQLQDIIPSYSNYYLNYLQLLYANSFYIHSVLKMIIFVLGCTHS